MLSSAHVPEDKRSPLLALGILSISFLMSVSNAVSGTIPLMEKYFSDVSRANVELLIVIPTGGVLLGTVISGLVSNLLGKKYTVIAGLTISMIFGIIPAFIFNYPAILISRAMFGVGMGFSRRSVCLTSRICSLRRRGIACWGGVIRLAQLVMPSCFSSPAS